MNQKYVRREIFKRLRITFKRIYCPNSTSISGYRFFDVGGQYIGQCELPYMSFFAKLYDNNYAEIVELAYGQHEGIHNNPILPDWTTNIEYAFRDLVKADGFNLRYTDGLWEASTEGIFETGSTPSMAICLWFLKYSDDREVDGYSVKNPPMSFWFD